MLTLVPETLLLINRRQLVSGACQRIEIAPVFVNCCLIAPTERLLDRLRQQMRNSFGVPQQDRIPLG
jgi:hypothetical protein